jgi:hypothetical protein
MRTLISTVLAMLLCVLVVGQGCVLEEKVIELVLSGETCVEFVEYHESADWNTPIVLNYAEEIRQILEDNDIDINKMKRAVLRSASYEVLELDGEDDWEVSGFITVQRGSGEVKRIVQYTTQSLKEVLHTPKYANLDAAGVAIINGALASFVGDPYTPIIMTFEVDNDTVDPLPTGAKPLSFTWEACIQIQIIYEEKFDLPEML